jgi:hypothetical protein
MFGAKDEGERMQAKDETGDLWEGRAWRDCLVSCFRSALHNSIVIPGKLA